MKKNQQKQQQQQQIYIPMTDYCAASHLKSSDVHGEPLGGPHA